jgi:hypothetical protein
VLARRASLHRRHLPALQRLDVTGRIAMTGPRLLQTSSAVSLGCAVLLAASVASGAPVLPDFGSATFDPSQPIDNPYFPMPGGATLRYTGSEDGEPVDIFFEHTNEGLGPVLLGVQTFIQHDREFEDGLLIEDTLDFFAQDTDGNVWYFGEDSTAYEYDDEGNLIDTDTSGSWRAGVGDALPGFIMPVDLEPGFNYYQEFAPENEALDQATTYALLASLTTDGGTYENVLQVLETTELEPDEFEFKYYAPGVGLILVEEDLDENLENPGTVFTLQPRSAPEPTTLGTLLIGVAMLGAVRLRRPKPLR